MLSDYRVDLHIHTVLSPCGELEMGAPEIVERALEAGLDCIAVTDHNAAENAPALQEAASGTGLVVLAGLEVQTAEDIHVVAIFETTQAALDFQDWLWKGLRRFPNDPDIFGYQVVVDGTNRILRQEETLLVQGVTYDIEEVLEEVHRRRGIAFPAHVDRPAFSYTAALGPLPEGLPVDAIELSRTLSPDEAERWRASLPARTVLRNSDAHSLDALHRNHCSTMLLERPSFGEIALALRERAGRRVFWPWARGDR
ncbi:MAG: PHP domain-containing protein [Synergistales bacterium]|nr:PHP domain-containing protein [Synergistales bacterium]